MTYGEATWGDGMKLVSSSGSVECYRQTSPSFAALEVTAVKKVALKEETQWEIGGVEITGKTPEGGFITTTFGATDEEKKMVMEFWSVHNPDRKSTSKASSFGTVAIEGKPPYHVEAKSAADLKKQQKKLSITSEQAKGAARDEFQKLDLNSDGKLDLEEWAKYTAKFGLTTSESVQAFKAWDLDDSKGIDIDEFEKVMSEVMQLQIDVANDLLDAVGMAPEEMARLVQFGCCCCLCTACLSWLPLYCKMKAIGKKVEQKANHKDGPLKEADLSEPGRKIKARLLHGPGSMGAPKPEGMQRQMSGQV